MIGKLTHAPQRRGTAQADRDGYVLDRCMSNISCDTHTVDPTKSKSINSYQYATVFVDQHSMYYWAYGHNSTAQVPALFDKFYADTAPLRDKHWPILCLRRNGASVNISAEYEK